MKKFWQEMRFLGLGALALGLLGGCHDSFNIQTDVNVGEKATDGGDAGRGGFAGGAVGAGNGGHAGSTAGASTGGGILIGGNAGASAAGSVSFGGNAGAGGYVGAGSSTGQAGGAFVGNFGEGGTFAGSFGDGGGSAMGGNAGEGAGGNQDSLGGADSSGSAGVAGCGGMAGAAGGGFVIDYMGAKRLQFAKLAQANRDLLQIRAGQSPEEVREAYVSFNDFMPVEDFFDLVSIYQLQPKQVMVQAGDVAMLKQLDPTLPLADTLDAMEQELATELQQKVAATTDYAVASNADGFSQVMQTAASAATLKEIQIFGFAVDAPLKMLEVLAKENYDEKVSIIQVLPDAQGLPVTYFDPRLRKGKNVSSWSPKLTENFAHQDVTLNQNWLKVGFQFGIKPAFNPGTDFVMAMDIAPKFFVQPESGLDVFFQGDVETNIPCFYRGIANFAVPWTPAGLLHEVQMSSMEEMDSEALLYYTNNIAALLSGQDEVAKAAFEVGSTCPEMLEGGKDYFFIFRLKPGAETMIPAQQDAEPVKCYGDDATTPKTVHADWGQFGISLKVLVSTLSDINDKEELLNACPFFFGLPASPFNRTVAGEAVFGRACAPTAPTEWGFVDPTGLAWAPDGQFLCRDCDQDSFFDSDFPNVGFGSNTVDCSDSCPNLGGCVGDNCLDNSGILCSVQCGGDGCGNPNLPPANAFCSHDGGNGQGGMAGAGGSTSNGCPGDCEPGQMKQDECTYGEIKTSTCGDDCSWQETTPCIDPSLVCFGDEKQRCYVECTDVGSVNGALSMAPVIYGVQACQGGIWGTCDALETCDALKPGCKSGNSVPCQYACVGSETIVSGARACLANTKTFMPFCYPADYVSYCQDEYDMCQNVGEKQDCQTFCGDGTTDHLEVGQKTCMDYGPAGKFWGVCDTGESCDL